MRLIDMTHLRPSNTPSPDGGVAPLGGPCCRGAGFGVCRGADDAAACLRTGTRAGFATAVAMRYFSVTSGAINWALSGFANSTVWLIFAAFIFSLGYEKTGLGRRISLLLVAWLGGHTLSLGYAVTLADAILAPFTPSNTARSGVWTTRSCTVGIPSGRFSWLPGLGM